MPATGTAQWWCGPAHLVPCARAPLAVVDLELMLDGMCWGRHAYKGRFQRCRLLCPEPPALATAAARSSPCWKKQCPAVSHQWIARYWRRATPPNRCCARSVPRSLAQRRRAPSQHRATGPRTLLLASPIMIFAVGGLTYHPCRCAAAEVVWRRRTREDAFGSRPARRRNGWRRRHGPRVVRADGRGRAGGRAV